MNKYDYAQCASNEDITSMRAIIAKTPYFDSASKREGGYKEWKPNTNYDAQPIIEKRKIASSCC